MIKYLNVITNIINFDIFFGIIKNDLTSKHFRVFP